MNLKSAAKFLYHLPRTLINGIPFLSRDQKKRILTRIDQMVINIEKNWLGDLTPVQVMVLSFLIFQVIKYAVKISKKIMKLRLHKVKEFIFTAATYIPQIQAEIQKESEKSI